METMATTPSTADRATMGLGAWRAKTSSTVGQATISWTEDRATPSTVGGASYYPGAGMGSGTSSIAVKAGTHILLTRKTTWTAAARRSYRTRFASLMNRRCNTSVAVGRPPLRAAAGRQALGAFRR